MTPEGELHLRARHLMRTAWFTRLSTAAATTLASHDVAPLAAAVAETGATADEVMFVARVQGVSAWLAALDERSPGALEAPLAAALHDERARIEARQQGLATDLRTLARAAQVHALPFVPLKGGVLAIRRPDLSAKRPTADIDVLVDEADAARWARMLGGLGYRRGLRTLKHDSFRKPAATPITGFAEDPAYPRRVEVHYRLHEVVLGRTIDVTDRYRADLLVERLDAVPVHLPTAMGLALHLWLHVASGVTRRGVRLVQFVDLAHLDGAAAVGEALAEELDELAWGVWTVAEGVLPGALPRACEAPLARVAPPRRRQRAWRGQRGMLGGVEGVLMRIVRQLRLCRSAADGVRHLAAHVPQRAQLEEAYGDAARSRAAGLLRYAVDRLRRRPPEADALEMRRS